MKDFEKNEMSLDEALGAEGVVEAEPHEPMTEAEKEKRYKEALSYLTSSLTNDENIEQSLATLEMLGDYKDAPDLLARYRTEYQKRLEEDASLEKRRRVMRGLQWFFTFVGFAVVTLLIVILVYGLRNPPWR